MAAETKHIRAMRQQQAAGNSAGTHKVLLMRIDIKNRTCLGVRANIMQLWDGRGR